MRDVHALTPTRGGFGLRSVGISRIRQPVSVHRPDRVQVLAVEFEVAVDLPGERKGSDLSRNAQILAEVVERTAVAPVSSLEAACSAIARELLQRHPYATEASVSAKAEYFLPRGIRPEQRSYEEYTLLADSRAIRRGDGPPSLSRAIGAEAVGMTACPCAMETCRELLTKEFPALAQPGLEGLPMVTHNQRNRTTLRLEFTDGGEVEVDELIAAVEAAQSSPTYAILKRGAEAQVVLDAHRRPKFVEDVIRDLLASLPERFPGLGDEVVADALTVSEESIHKYDVRAAHRARLGDLRRHPL